MNDIRARFEEIWPVPDGIYFAQDEYYPYDGAHATDDIVAKCEELDARLDTFTRCQETTDVYVSLISQLVYELEDCYQIIAANRGGCFTAECFRRAKQIMEQNK